MYNQIMEYYGLTKDLDKSAFFVTENYKNVLTFLNLKNLRFL